MATKTATDPARVLSDALTAAAASVKAADARARMDLQDATAAAQTTLDAAVEYFHARVYEAERASRGGADQARVDAAGVRETALVVFDDAMRAKWDAPDVVLRAVATGGWELADGRRRIGGYLEQAAGAFRVDGPGAPDSFIGSEPQARAACWGLLGAV